MAIYSENQDPNEKVKTSKELTIEKINEIIEEYGGFSTCEVEADHSPCLDIKGRLSYLAEDFRVGGCTIRVYDPSSYSSDEIDEYDEFYEEFDEDQLEYILELAEKWEEQNTEEE